MNMPKSGRVVIIDDKFEEALPLIRILSKDSVAVTFFSGRIEELPPEPFRDVRVIFLDVVLEEVQGQDNKTIVSKLVGVTRRIISRENGPFILVIWTKHPELIREIKKALKKEGFYSFIVDLEKHEFFEWKDEKWLFNEEKIEELHKEIEEELNRIDIFRVFIDWENVIHDAASLTVNEISKLAEYNDQWNQEIKKIFYNLAKAWVGKKIDDIDDSEKIRSALFTFNQMFDDVFERELQRMNILDIGLEEKDIAARIKGKINSRLLLDNIMQKRDIYPGNVYKVSKEIKQMIYDAINRDALISDFARSIGKKETDLLNIKGRIKKKHKREFDRFFKNVRERLKEVSIPVNVELSPVCDHVQKKLKKNRYVDGFLCPAIIRVGNIQIKMHEKLNKHALFLYTTPIIQYNKKQFILILDFRYFTSADDNFFSDKELLFRIRKELLSDIQTKLSSHINRTGVLYLD